VLYRIFLSAQEAEKGGKGKTGEATQGSLPLDVIASLPHFCLVLLRATSTTPTLIQTSKTNRQPFSRHSSTRSIDARLYPLFPSKFSMAAD
jgi:hypothetical protein